MVGDNQSLISLFLIFVVIVYFSKPIQRTFVRILSRSWKPPLARRRIDTSLSPKGPYCQSLTLFVPGSGNYVKGRGMGMVGVEDQAMTLEICQRQEQI